MPYAVVIPRLGLTMESGRVVQWYKRSGENVAKGEPLFAVESDKAVQDIEALAAGAVYPLPNLPDEPLPIATVIGYILAPGEALPADLAAPTAISATAAQPAAGALAQPVLSAAASPVDDSVPARKFSSPAARRRAQELGLDWRNIERPGGGPILLAHVEQAQAQRARAPEQPAAWPRKEVYYPGTRQAETLILDVDATALVRLHEQLSTAHAARKGASLSYEELLARLAAAAVTQAPDVRLLADFSLDSVFAGEAGPETLLLALEPTQVAVLAVGRISARPAEWQGQLALRQRATLALTFDRGLLPRAAAQQLLEHLRALVEQPYLLLTV